MVRFSCFELQYYPCGLRLALGVSSIEAYRNWNWPDRRAIGAICSTWEVLSFRNEQVWAFFDTYVRKRASPFNDAFGESPMNGREAQLP